MNNNILLIVEGSVFEERVFEDVFRKYGFRAEVREEKFAVDEVGDFDKTVLEKEENNIVIFQGPRTRIHDFLKYFDEEKMSIEKAFSYAYGYFSFIFLIYDVDHNDNDDIEEMYRRFPDETSGMLLLSSPCIEVLADYNREREESRYSHLEEYKRDINIHYNGGTRDYIKEHFDEIMLYFLEKNYQDFGEKNIMEHPRLIIDSINKYNIRHNEKDKEKSYVIYRYFSTVIYVAIAHANKLTREIENYDIVKSFFLDKINN